MNSRKKRYTKIALTISVCLLILWSVLGTGTSLAWFTDTTPVHENVFLIGDLDMLVSYRLEDGSYREVTSETSVFDDKALYEPGYVQVVQLKIENQGDVPFEYKLAVDVNAATVVPGILGNDIYLPNYLKYGVVFGADEAALNRETAKLLAEEDFPETMSLPLNVYTEKDTATVEVGKARYVAIIVRMPESVGNTANHRSDVPPSVDLGLTVTASQKGTLQ